MAERVLIVEDEESVAVTLQEILAQEGYDVSLCGDTTAALAYVAQEQFDLALLDLRVGEGSGLAVLTALREVAPDTVAVILTGYGSLETAVQAIRQGAFDYLLKPCNVDELKSAIARGLEQRRRFQLAARAGSANEELEQALADAQRAQNDFLAIAGHELKTPLSVVIGWAQHIQRQLARGTADQAVEQLEVVVSQARRLAQVVEACGDIVRLQRGPLSLDRRQHDLRVIAERCVTDLRAAYPNHQLKLVCGPEPVLVHVDGARLTQVLSNLLDNATKFSPAGGEVSLHVMAVDDTARVEITDHGLGLEPSDYAPIFELFYQGDRNVTARRFSGMGVGLYLSRALVEAHDGRIEVTSPGPGKGSTFTVVLPLATARP